MLKTVTATHFRDESSMEAPKLLCLVCFMSYQCISISLGCCSELEMTPACTVPIYNHMSDKRQRRSEKDGVFSQIFPRISVGILLSPTTDSLEITPSFTVCHICFNHFIVYGFVLKGGGSFVQVLFGRILSFSEIIKYFRIPGSLYGFDNRDLTVYWDPLELRLLREVY